jgi:hypothetical protein
LQINKLEAIFQEIWEHDANSRERVKVFFNPFQKYTFLLMFLFFITALIVALSTRIEVYPWQKPVALILVLLCLLSYIAYQISFIFEACKIFKVPTKKFLEPVTKSAVKDFELAASFSRFTNSQLYYAKERLSLETTQMKSRVAMLLGVLEKVGIVPVLVTWILAFYKYLANNTVVFEQIDWLVYGLLCLYLVAFLALIFIHKLERYLLLINTAIEIKANKSFQGTAAN